MQWHNDGNHQKIEEGDRAAPSKIGRQKASFQIDQQGRERQRREKKLQENDQAWTDLPLEPVGMAQWAR